MVSLYLFFSSKNQKIGNFVKVWLIPAWITLGTLHIFSRVSETISIDRLLFEWSFMSFTKTNGWYLHTQTVIRICRRCGQYFIEKWKHWMFFFEKIEYILLVYLLCIVQVLLNYSHILNSISHSFYVESFM